MRPLSRISESTWVRVYRADAVTQQAGRCAYCRSGLTMRDATADHVHARHNGGQTSRGNIKAACAPCNLTKKAMSEKAFMAKIKSPGPADSIYVWLAWSRRRIALATERACRRIEGAAA